MLLNNNIFLGIVVKLILFENYFKIDILFYIYTDFQNSSYLKKENVYIGILFASKPIVQILFNMFVGPLVDRIGFDVPMFCGYIVLTSSCLRKLSTISV